MINREVVLAEDSPLMVKLMVMVHRRCLVSELDPQVLGEVVVDEPSTVIQG